MSYFIRRSVLVARLLIAWRDALNLTPEQCQAALEEGLSARERGATPWWPELETGMFDAVAMLHWGAAGLGLPAGLLRTQLTAIETTLSSLSEHPMVSLPIDETEARSIQSLLEINGYNAVDAACKAAVAKAAPSRSGKV